MSQKLWKLSLLSSHIAQKHSLLRSLPSRSSTLVNHSFGTPFNQFLAAPIKVSLSDNTSLRAFSTLNTAVCNRRKYNEFGSRRDRDIEKEFRQLQQFIPASQRYRTFDGRQGSSSQLAFLLDMWKNKQSRQYIYISLALCLAFYLYNLDSAPISHRRRFLWVPRSWEVRLGNSTNNDILSQYRNCILPPSHPIHIQTQRIVTRLLTAAEQLTTSETSSSIIADNKWEIHIIDDPRAPPNAFVVPGGKIFVFSSILPYTSTDNGLATVLSHEISHQLARHTGEELSKSPFRFLATLIVGYAIGDFSLVSRMVSLLQLSHSRAQESEADYMGLIIMSKACFDPRESIPFWRRMQKMQLSGRAPPEFLSTHPSDSTRLKNMAEWMPEALNIREGAHCDDMNSFFSLRGF